MIDKKKLHQILSSLWKNDDSVGKTYYNQALQDVQTAIDLQEEPVSEKLEQAIDTYLKSYWGGEKEKQDWPFLKKMAIHFADWQKEQFEKNRLKHCNSITNEQAELEQGFIDQHLDKHQRMPTFLDAIEYGMRLQKEKIEEALLSEVLPCFMHGGEADEVVAKLDEVLNQKK